jgi:regulator of sigma E protease
MLLNTILLMSGGWVQALQLLAALSLLILLHEFGHFFFARLFGTRVEKFYLFFDFLFPFSGLLNFSLFKKKVGDTTYGLGWFPLGGYVKISGMVDESMDKDALAKPPEPWEYRSKKAYQRLFIMLGGIIMNVIVAMILYAIIFGVWGERYLPVQNAKYGIMADSTAKSIGLQNGDQIIALDGRQVEKFNKIVPEIIFSDVKVIKVLRKGEYADVKIPAGTVKSIIKSKRGTFIAPRVPTVIAEVTEKSEAEKMGMKAGDSIVAVNGAPLMYYDEFTDAKKKLLGKPISIDVMRAGNVVTLNGNVPLEKGIGFAIKNAEEFFTYNKTTYGIGGAIGRGFTYTWEQFGNYWDQLKFLFTSKEVKASESVGGIVSFGKLFPSEFTWFEFLQLTAFISIILAFMNLLPIPGLDGGYVIFLLYEMITRRKVSEKVMEYATSVGLVLLLGLMVYANGLDIFRLFQK